MINHFFANFLIVTCRRTEHDSSTLLAVHDQNLSDRRRESPLLPTPFPPPHQKEFQKNFHHKMNSIAITIAPIGPYFCHNA